MKKSLNTLAPGLAERVESVPESKAGVMEAVAVIQHHARKKGII
jgi:hypothetical protein